MEHHRSQLDAQTGMRFAAAAAAAAFFFAAAMAWAQAPAARNLTVRVFSAHVLRHIELTPLGKPGDSVTVTFDHGRLASSSFQRGKHPGSLRMEGGFRAQTATGEIRASGIWRVKADSNGLELLLTLPSERYVALALNGEAAPDEPAAALEAMAIAVRTFALTHTGRHGAEGFDLCDSTHCQALGYGAIRPEIRQATLATSGETLWYGRRRAAVFYTQNCGGETEDAASVWPGEREPYLKSHPDPYCLRRAHAWGHGATWSADIATEKMLAIAHAEGWQMPSAIERASVTRKTASGRASLVEFYGPGGNAFVSASSLRFAVNRVLGWNQLRSDWFTVSASSRAIHFAGKGFGHGVGLCQAGAYEMAAEGKTSREILDFYFPGTEVRIGVEDHGWKSVPGRGWTLMTTADAPEAGRQGDAAWRKALSLFPPRGTMTKAEEPIVYLMPSTELFRQTADEPGWMLASARGQEIFLEPEAVLEKQGGVQAALVHEFLHVLVEREAGTQTPLWLREGIVEALAEPARHPRSQDGDLAGPDAIDRALARPRSQEQSRQAHAAAAALASGLIERYGLHTVRGWLVSGAPRPTPAGVR